MSVVEDDPAGSATGTVPAQHPSPVEAAREMLDTADDPAKALAAWWGSREAISGAQQALRRPWVAQDCWIRREDRDHVDGEMVAFTSHPMIAQAMVDAHNAMLELHTGSNA